jgi:tripartite-type tricarboxylate transporter receptor subunit TctC
VKIRVARLTLASVLLLALPAAAQNYPVRPVRVIVPFTAGGNTDLTARSIGARLSEVFGQQVVVENRPGGATNIGTELVAKAPPDGYTILMGGATNAINMSTQAKPPYDTLRDFAPIILCEGPGT